MKRLLINNPVGPLPNVRLRYLKPECIAAYELACLDEGMMGYARPLPHVGSFIVWLDRNRPRSRRPKHTSQVGLVDRFADRPYGKRKN
jgi:hypothetical protein